MRFFTASLLPALCVFAGILALILATERAYGPHWDAPHYLVTADRIAEYLEHRGAGDSIGSGLPPISDVDFYLPRGDRHPPLVKVLAGITEFLFRERLGTLASLRVSVAILSALLGAVLFAFLRPPLGPWYALTAVFLWIGTPRVFAHAHFLALDQPVAVFYFLSLIAFFRLHEGWFRGPRPGGWRRVALPAAAVLALALGFLTKHQSHFVIPVVLGWSLFEARRTGGPCDARLLRWLLLVVSLGLTAFALFIAGWPSLWHDTARRIQEYLVFVTRHGQVPVIYFGGRYPPGSPPWHFPVVMWFLTAPIASLGLFAAGCCLRPANTLRSLRRFLLFGALAPFLFLALPGVSRFDGVRHLLPAAPFFAAVAVLGLREGSRRLARLMSTWVRVLTHRTWEATLATIGLAAAISPAVASHPFQHVFYNSLAGGLSGAVAKGMEADYLGVSTRALLPFLNRTLRDGDVLFVAGMNPEVFHPALHRPWRNARQTDILVPAVRIYSLSTARHLVWAAGRPFVLANFRRSVDPAALDPFIAGRKPLARVNHEGVDLSAVYALGWESGIPSEPIFAKGPIVLLKAAQSATVSRWEVIWSCREPPVVDWGISWEWRDEAGDPIESGHETQLVPGWGTRYWLPGDAYRASYPRAGDLRGGSLFIGIWPHPQPAQTQPTLSPIPVTRE